MFFFFVVPLLIFGFTSDGVLSKSRSKSRAESDQDTFPSDFLWGASTSAYQIEGAWNISGKSISIWDTLTHNMPYLIEGAIKTGDVAADSYHMYQKDVDALVNLGANTYRFSISWTRILPNGDISVVNEAGIKYYNDLIDALLANNIEPVVTMFHWDLPQSLQELGGLTNRAVIPYFMDYAMLLFGKFGDRVKYWITFNEPYTQCANGYGDGDLAPRLNSPGIGIYLCGHVVLLAHGEIYRMHELHFKSKYNAKLGMANVANFMVPKTDSDEDKAAAERSQQFLLGWFTHPICSKEGNYPQVMIDTITAESKNEGRSQSRLPTFTEEEIKMIRGTCDFLGVNHYTSALIEDGTNDHSPSFENDQNTTSSTDPNWPTTAGFWLFVYPKGISGALNWIRKEYDNPLVYITENGYPDRGELHDDNRISYISQYLSEVLNAINDGCNVKGYMHWSLIDNFEWLNGYTLKFGLYSIDFESKSKDRIPKDSVAFYKEIITTGKIPEQPKTRTYPSRGKSEKSNRKTVNNKSGYRKKKKHNLG